VERRPSAPTRAERERLGHVVVGAEGQPLDPVGDGAAGGEHEHPGQRALGGKLAAQLVAGHAGQVAVEHDHVVAGDRGLLVPVHPVVRDVDRHALAAQPPGHRVGQSGLVLHHQHPHASSLPEPAAVRLGPRPDRAETPV
jgi:hypothetical protein